MIAALYLSQKTKSSNHFLHNSVQFGWEALESILKREVTRIRQNQIPRVPELKESYIYCDPWTCLNVNPAKIMQVNGLYSVYYSSTELYHYVVPQLPFLITRTRILAELQEYAAQVLSPPDADSLRETVAYLTACNSIFE